MDSLGQLIGTVGGEFNGHKRLFVDILAGKSGGHSSCLASSAMFKIFLQKSHDEFLLWGQ